MKEFSKYTREKNLKEIPGTEFDLAIIGGGINGAGIARDAASRGMKVVLVEADDFASGTSSRSSKLVHGGIRYLENFEFGLVFEALSERAKLFDLAPHLVHPLRFVLPVYKGARVGLNKLGMGMMLYDVLSLFEAPELNERLGAEEVKERLGSIDTKNLEGAYVYSDAYMDDDRLTIESLRSANDFGANIVNYVSADSAVYKDGKVVGLKCTDQLSGNKLEIKAKHFVSSVGPWTDIFCEKIFEDWKSRMRPTKGVHLTFARERLQLDQAVVMVSNDEKRIVFGIPRHEMTIFGTTDTDFSGDPKDVKVTKEDVEYLLELINEYFPDAKIQESDIVSSYCGVRPLVEDGSETEGKTSREHEIWTDPRNFTIVAGGKYTTYRLIAEQAVEKLLESFTLEEQVQFDKSKSKQPLNTKATFSAMNRARAHKLEWQKDTGFSDKILDKLIDRHGLETSDLISDLELKDVPGELEMWKLELKHAMKNTMCLSLRDYYFRRVPLFLSYQDHGEKYKQELAGLASQYLGSNVDDQIQQLDGQMAHELSWRKDFT
ncbi:MAG: glycerol-3-phosphate dehydrogenase/oxidase [Bdellovibrionales bacterium]